MTLELKDHLGIMLCYLLMAWPPHLFLGGIGTVLALMVRVLCREAATFMLKASWLMAGYLFICGFALNAVWNLAVFGRLYWAYDYAGWECSPFGLLICGTLEAPARYFHGMTELSIRLLWLIYAVLAWGLAALLTWKTLSRGRPH